MSEKFKSTWRWHNSLQLKRYVSQNILNNFSNSKSLSGKFNNVLCSPLVLKRSKKSWDWRRFGFSDQWMSRNEDDSKFTCHTHWPRSPTHIYVAITKFDFVDYGIKSWWNTINDQDFYIRPDLFSLYKIITFCPINLFCGRLWNFFSLKHSVSIIWNT